MAAFRHRTKGVWEGWITFFQEGVPIAAASVERDIIAIADLR